MKGMFPLVSQNPRGGPPGARSGPGERRPAMSANPEPASIHDVEEQLQPIPESSRTTNVSGQFWIWCGANIAPINWVLGALGINLGLGLSDTLLVLILGNLIGMGLFGLFVLLGQRTGVTGMVLGRAAFGRRGRSEERRVGKECRS